jgi:hypothetical protein
MTEELTAEERALLEHAASVRSCRLNGRVFARWMRCLDAALASAEQLRAGHYECREELAAALARAEAADAEAKRSALANLKTHQDWTVAHNGKLAAESALAEATALLARVHQFGVPHPAIRKDIGAFLSRTPAPAAKAETECCDGHAQSGAHQPGCPRTVEQDSGKVRRVDLTEPTLIERIEAECNDWEAHAFGNGAQSRLAMIRIRDLIRASKAGGA